MMSQTTALRIAVMLGACAWSSIAIAQDDPFADEPDESAAEEAPAESEAEAAPAGAEGEGEGAAPDEEELSSPAASEQAPVTGQTEATVDLSAGLDTSATEIDAESAGPPGTPDRAANPDRAPMAGSLIPRPKHLVDGILVIDSPLTTEYQGREYLQTRRQLGGFALPDTTAALNQGGSGTSSLLLRLQPTLILLNGRRLVTAPYSARRGADYVDINQLPITLIDHVEFSKGLSAALYGDGAIGGTVNFVTRRDFQGIEIDAGAQATDKFDQGEEDVTLTVGAGTETTGLTAMLSFFNRSPLAASDRDWIAERGERTEQLLGSPGSYQQSSNFDYPFPDPFCDLATQFGHANGLEVRLRGYGPPETLGKLPMEEQDRLIMTHDEARGTNLRLPTAMDGKIDALETSTYCAADLTGKQDLLLKEQRFQAYTTLWHKFSSHTEAYGEFGYYRNDNENRTAPSFPINRITPDPNAINPVWVPRDHADQPVQAPGFAAVEGLQGAGRTTNTQFLVGRIIGNYADANVNTRRVDVMRGVIGIGGDFKGFDAGDIIDSWGWDVSGVYSTSDQISSVQDVLLDKLAAALNSCQADKIVDRMPVPKTIKERQEAGCFNPFYSSVTNSNVLDPFNLSARSASSANGFVTSDTDMPGDPAYGLQDGGYICDPNDPDSPPCPAEFDRDGDGVFELAGTPNTKEVIDRIIGEQITHERRHIGVVEGVLRGDLAKWEGGAVSFALNAQYRREGLEIDYDAAYNQRLYGFLFGAPDVNAVSRDIAGGTAELGATFLDGLIQPQAAVRIENVSEVGTALNWLGALALRPFATSSLDALEWLLVRGHIGQGHVAPSLMQMHGTQTEFQSVEYRGSTLFVPYQIKGNPELDFEKYTTISGGVQYDYVGLHVGADFWMTTIDDLIAGDNAQTLIKDCQDQFSTASFECEEIFLLSMTESLDHLEGEFGNIASVETNGIDGGLGYTLDTKRRGLGDIGTFALSVQGTFINQYLIKSPRALREFYRGRDQMGATLKPGFNTDGTRDYSNLTAEYDAAGWRNLENFAGPMPKLRFSVPLRWSIGSHLIGVTMRYIGGYNDDSEYTVEKQGLDNIARLELAIGEEIPAWTVFDANYALAFENEGWALRFAVGVINIADTAPPAVESPLGYEVGVHDPRGRVLYLRVNGQF